jgi:uncharacterized protein YcbK (DUF882 family)
VAVDRWHAPVTSPAPVDAEGRPFLVLEILNTGERVELAPQHPAGHFAASDLDRLGHALRDTRRGLEHPIDPLLADLVYDVQLRFRSNLLRVVSGYRAPSRGGHSNHGRGRAVDLVVPGASDEEVARYVRARGFVGVGVYPTSGFLHVDVRPASYFWVDASGPGQRNCERGTLFGEAAASDALAKASGRKRPPAWGEPAGDADAAFAERRPARELEAEPHEEAVEEDDLDAE